MTSPMEPPNEPMVTRQQMVRTTFPDGRVRDSDPIDPEAPMASGVSGLVRGVLSLSGVRSEIYERTVTYGPWIRAEEMK